MKKFVELIKRVHQERFSVVMNRIVAEKIPVAFLSIAPIEQAIELVKNLRAQNLNIDNLITITPPPSIQTDFRITNFADAGKLHPRPEYILVTDNISARVANKYVADCTTVNLDRGNTDFIYHMFMNNLDKLQEVYESLIDEESRKTFCGYWLGSITSRIGDFVYTNNAHYLIEGFIPEKGAIAIDGGAFDGGTAKLFTDMGYKVYAFELTKENFEIAQKLAIEKNFVVENFGLGSFKHETKYNLNGAASRVNPGGEVTAQITTIDNYVFEKNLPRVDFIKLDVEGAELDTLRGARKTIARWKPILALSAYHKWDDFWTLMDFVKSIRPDYEWALRHFPEVGEDLPAFSAFQNQELLNDLGLEPENRDYWECCLMAR